MPINGENREIIRARTCEILAKLNELHQGKIVMLANKRWQRFRQCGLDILKALDEEAIRDEQMPEKS